MLTGVYQAREPDAKPEIYHTVAENLQPENSMKKPVKEAADLINAAGAPGTSSQSSP